MFHWMRNLKELSGIWNKELYSKYSSEKEDSEVLKGICAFCLPAKRPSILGWSLHREHTLAITSEDPVFLLITLVTLSKSLWCVCLLPFFINCV